MNIRKILAALLALMMVLTMAASAEALTAWEEASGIYNGDETDEELYQKALEEGATVTLYSISSRCGKVADAFMAKYPGLECVPFDISTNELLEKVTREYDAGQHVADVVHIKDQDGSMYLEYVANGIFYNYKPTEILSHIDPSYTETATPLYIELTQLFYNTEAYPDGSPITNIWQLTEPEWKGRITMQNPLDNLSWGSWITGFCVGDEPDRLAAAYEELYGEALTLSPECENAGYEFLKRLHDNQPIYCASSDECAEAVGTPGQENPPVGFSASSKLRKAVDNGWVFAPVNLYPDTGIPAVNTLYIVEGCEHPAAAKLLVRFMMGGTDGDTSGYKPFNTLGGWPVRDDIEPAEGSVPYAELNVAGFDANEIYVNYNLVRDFWQMLG
ncbi:MAG: ABC transporter substrate-binding protein [Clostridia bacterium]|nr:ABC transporter substrate-binding protein [Clostridia bacterium]